MASDEKAPRAYFGETTCQKPKCGRKAYFMNDQWGACCGYHAPKATRTQLPRNPRASEVRADVLKKHAAAAEDARRQNVQNGLRGQLCCTKMKMFSGDVLRDGYVSVFPNFKHANRTDGLGMPSLSPKSFGIEHGQPGLPRAATLENFHQGNKVFACHVGADGEPTADFFKSQRAMYVDSVPHRHREEATPKRKGGNKNVPEYSVWVDADGTRHKLTYLESRELYCTFYEQRVSVAADYRKLEKLLADGYNLMIVGYDAYDVRQPLLDCYMDVSRPFGHELVLYTLLSARPQDYPWRKCAKYLSASGMPLSVQPLSNVASQKPAVAVSQEPEPAAKRQKRSVLDYF